MPIPDDPLEKPKKEPKTIFFGSFTIDSDDRMTITDSNGSVWVLVSGESFILRSHLFSSVTYTISFAKEKG